MNENVSSGLLIAANLFLACLLVSIGIFLSQNGKTLSSSVNAKIANVNQNISEDNLTRFDGATVKGADIVNCIKKYGSEITITVTKLCGADEASAMAYTAEFNGSETFKNLPSYAYDDMRGNPLDDGHLYINPNAEFTGEIHRNANGMITNVSFTQTKYHQDAYEVPDTGNTTIIVNNTNDDTSSALTTAIAGLTSASASLNSAITNLQNTGTGVNTVQAETLAILQTLSTEVLPGMSAKIDDLNGGSSSTVSQDLKSLQGQVSSLYDLISKSELHPTEHDVDDIYKDTTTANNYLTEISANIVLIRDKLGTISTQLATIQSSIDSLSAQLSAHASSTASSLSAIQQALAALNESQAEQNAHVNSMLASIAEGVAQQNYTIARQRDTIQRQRATIDSQSDTISYLYDVIRSMSSSAKNTGYDVETYGDLKDYANAEAAKASKFYEVQDQYGQVLRAMNSVSNSYSNLSDWLKDHPGGKV